MKQLLVRAAVLAPVAVLMSACGATGAWQGAATEKMYDQNLEAQRATAILNVDDYYEIHKDGRIYVIADVADLQGFEATGELPFRVTRIGGGPQGETIVFGIAKPESKKKEGFGAVEMYDGRRRGAEKDFYGEVFRDNAYYVFGSWAELDAFRKGQAGGPAAIGSAPNGATVHGAQPALLERFKTLHAAR